MVNLMCKLGKAADAVALFDEHLPKHEGMADRILAVSQGYSQAMRSSINLKLPGKEAPPPPPEQRPYPIVWVRPSLPSAVEKKEEL